jgi:glutamate-1-semialdehyde 2,1-aminomutase
MLFENSNAISARLNDYISSGANSPGRLFNEVETPALVVKEAFGSMLVDVDGNEYIDFVMGLGPLILGHCPDVVHKAVSDQLKKGFVYGMNCEHELELSRRIVEACPHMDKLRFTCSGTEAVMTAIRVARAHTNRSDILRFKGGYHGHSDNVLTYANKSAIRDNPKSVKNGIPDAVRDSTLICPYNDTKKAIEIVELNHRNLAAIIVEPVPTNMGLVLPNLEFLKTLRALCTEYNIVFICDEVVSGFRLCYGSVSDHLGVAPDLTTYGKIIGGGLPVGAYGGRADLMEHVSQKGGVFQGGSFAGNPLTMVAGVATLNVLAQGDVYAGLSAHATNFTAVVKAGFKEHGIPCSIQKYGSLASFIFTDKVNTLSSLDDVEKQNKKLYGRFHLEMTKRGILFAPTIEEPIFFSTAHSKEQVEFAASTSVEVLSEILTSHGVN